MKHYRILLLICLVPFLTNCAGQARQFNMAVGDQKQVIRIENKNMYYRAIGLRDVSGGFIPVEPPADREWYEAVGDELQDLKFKPRVLNTRFATALRDSLRNYNMLTLVGDPQYNLSATLVALDQPYIGVDYKATVGIHYSLTPANTDDEPVEPVYERTIQSDGRADISEVFDHPNLSRLATERAIQSNILKFIIDLNEGREITKPKWYE